MGLIVKSAGFMWHRKYVNWQHGRQLNGCPERGSKDTVNFADQAAIYALYDHNNRCLYIGQAGSGDSRGLYDRLKDHVNDYLFCMWERFSWFGFYSPPFTKASCTNEFKMPGCDVNRLMDVMEAISIHIHFPMFNRSMGRNLDTIKWYYQEEEYEEQEILLSEWKTRKKNCSSL